MSVAVPVLLTFLALSACRGHSAALPRTSTFLTESIQLPPTSTFLTESIQLLGKLLGTEVSCDKMNVTDIFAGDKQDNITELLCKASTVALEGRSCHKLLEGIHLNLLHLVQTRSSVHKVLCPVAAGNTTSLKHFLQDLHRLLQQLAKE